MSGYEHAYYLGLKVKLVFCSLLFVTVLITQNTYKTHCSTPTEVQWCHLTHSPPRSLSLSVNLFQDSQVPNLTWTKEKNYMVKTWYLQRSQKPSCSWYGRPCRTSLSSSWRSLPWSPWASLSTTLLGSRTPETVSRAAQILFNTTSALPVIWVLWDSFTSTNTHTLTHTHTHYSHLSPVSHYCWGQQMAIIALAYWHHFLWHYWHSLTHSHLHVLIHTF